jgi:hypothetical protein
MGDYEQALDIIEAGCDGLLKALTPLAEGLLREQPAA